MQKTIRSLLLLTIITGTIFTACGPDIKPPADSNFAPAAETAPAPAPEATSATEAIPAPESKPEVTVPAPVEPAPAEPAPVSIPDPAPESTSAPTPAPEIQAKYNDGTYIATGSYQRPEGTDSISVTVTLKDDVVESLNVVANATEETPLQFQQLFIAGINGRVVGKKLEDVGTIGQVNGSSLTGNGFNKAINSIRADALKQ